MGPNKKPGPKKKKEKPIIDRTLVVYQAPEKGYEPPPRMSEHEERHCIVFVTNMMLECQSRRVMQIAVMERYGLNYWQTERMFKLANKELADAFAITRKSEAVKAINRLEETFAYAKAMGQTSSMVAAQKEINRIVGIGDETLEVKDATGKSYTFNIATRNEDEDVDKPIEEQYPMELVEL